MRLSKNLLYVVLLTTICTSCGQLQKYTDRPNKEKAPESPIDLPNGTKLSGGLQDKIEFQFSDQNYVGISKSSRGDIDLRASSINDFAFKLFKEIAKKESSSNIVLSPLSVQAAFSLLYPATSTEIESGKEMADALNFNLDQAVFHEAMKGYLLALSNAFKDPGADKTLKWSLVNQVWVDKSFDFQPVFLQSIKSYYNAGGGKLNFRKEREVSRIAINDFIASNTNNLIKDLLPPEAIKANTAAVITNSVYMLADWLVPFEKNASSERAFTTAAAESVTLKTMTATRSLAYAALNDYAAVTLPYVGEKLAMLVVMPNNGGSYNEFEKDFGTGDFVATLDALKATKVKFSLPKFTIEWGTKSLKETLIELGMKRVFRDDFNHFPGLLEKHGQVFDSTIWIDDVFHKAKIIVDEKGTEAAAATAIVIAEKSSDEPEVDATFLVNRPALYFIYDIEHKGVIFMGRLADPR